MYVLKLQHRAIRPIRVQVAQIGVQALFPMVVKVTVVRPCVHQQTSHPEIHRMNVVVHQRLLRHIVVVVLLIHEVLLLAVLPVQVVLLPVIVLDQAAIRQEVVLDQAAIRRGVVLDQVAIRQGVALVVLLVPVADLPEAGEVPLVHQVEEDKK